MMILAFSVMIFALSSGLFNDSGEYLIVEGDSVAFLLSLLLKFGTAGPFNGCVPNNWQS